MEDRRNPRLFLDAPCGPEWGQLEINGHILPCTSMRDVSVSGAGVAVPLPLTPGQTVTVRLSAARLDIAVRGNVVWMRNTANTETRESYNAGIQFDPADLERSYLLYGLVRSNAPSLDAVAV